MRKRLMAAAAMAPLLIGSQIAQAQSLTISSDTSTPVATATAVSGGPGDIVLNPSVTFTIKDATLAFTVNSNNAVTVSGTVTSQNVDNATAILVQGPFSGTIYNGGTINLTESYTPGDNANSDGLTEAPYAQGQNRFGIRMTGAHTGAVTNAGGITIQGNNSTAISIENTLTGTLTTSGSIALAGDNNFAVRTTGEITGNVLVSGSVSMKGQNSVGIQTNAPVDGALKIYGSINTTGYAITSRQTGQIQTNIQKTPADVQQGGSALQIQGDVKGGVFLGAPPAGTVSTDTTTDADGDGVVDSLEASSSLTTYGSAPVIQIGGSHAVNLGNFGSGNNAFGLIIEGAVSAQGIFDGVSATGLDIGVGNAGVNLNGGIRVTGSLTSVSYQADSTAIHLERGVTAGQLLNGGTITASLTSAGANTATALQIDAGASLGSITNVGVIGASTNGDAANAIAVVDRGGGVSSVTNYGVISASQTAALPGEPITGKAIALDLSANTTGVTLQQLSNGSTAPSIVGDVMLGSGPNNVSLLAGSMTGALSLGSAPGSLTIDNGAVYQGALTYSGSQLNINLANGVLNDKSATTVGAASLNVGAASTLGVALDPTHNTSTVFNVSGAATFASGAKISATLLSTPSLSGQTFTIVKAGSLNVGALDSSLLSTLPYLFNGSIKTDAAARTIAVTVNTKTPAQLGFNKAETSAFNAIYAALPQDAGIQTSIVGAASRSALVSAYDQLLPNSNGDVFETARGMSKAVSRAAADRFDTTLQASEDEEEDDYVVSGFWGSEFYSGLEQKKADNTAYHSAALGVIGGYDFGGSGLTFSAASSNITRPGQPGDSLNSASVIELGVYAAPRFGALSIDARLGAGYLKVSNRRQMVASIVSGDTSTTSNIVRTANADWSGYDLTAHLGASLQMDVGKHLFFQPRVYADVFHLSEFSYNERNGGAGYDFNVSQRTSTQTNGTASLVTGLRFGNTFVISPQIEVGYDKVITGGPGDTTARFAYGGPSFSVAANKVDGAAVGRITLRGDGNYVHFSLQAGGEYSSSYHSMDAKAVFRLTF
ncbi:MAG: autotransporter outer membrane beta-barrel domain-containing protein [Caulobacteraceae bacterium]